VRHLLFGALLLALPVSAASQSGPAAAPLPDGKGKELVAGLCAGCHPLQTAVGKRATPDEWRKTIDAMVGRGARVSGDEAAVMAAYLGDHFGPASGTAAASPFPDGPGRDVLMGKCFQCHAHGMWRDLRQDRRRWEGVLYRMIGRGALWTEEEISAMADYLAAAFGPGPARSTP
jgi:cytochrome c5